jgi:transposase
MIIMASAPGTPVPAIAPLVAPDEDTVGDVVHAFNEKGLAALDPKWREAAPHLISDEDIGLTSASARSGVALMTHCPIRAGSGGPRAGRTL